MKDSRAINTDEKVTSSLYYMLKKGVFRQFVDCVKESVNTDNELMLCFRTDKVVIYYNNHQVWKLYVDKKGCPIVEISGNHARDSKNWKEIFIKIGYDRKKIKDKVNDANGKDLDFRNIVFKGDQIDGGFAKRTLPPILEMINDYFDLDKTYDYFKQDYHRKSNGEPGKRDLEEKRQQQLFYIDNKAAKDGIFVYDMEFAQEYESQSEKNKDLMKMGIDGSNQSDCLGIRFDKDGKPISLVYIEIKSKKSSVTGKSGLKDHLKKMDGYLSIPKGGSIDDTHISARVEEAKEIIKCYKLLGLRGASNIDLRQIDNLKDVKKQEILLVFTGNEEGGALSYCSKQGHNYLMKACEPYMNNKEYKISLLPDALRLV